MHLDKRKQLILKAIPQRKKTSKQLKEKALEEIYFRSSSLPQKKYTQPKQKEHSFIRRHQDIKGQSSQLSYKQRHSSQVKSSIEKIDQTQQLIPHRPIQRKNHSLPKYLYSEPSNSHNQSQFELESFKNTDQHRTKIKKMSQKDDILHLSQQKHRLQTLQEILKKKNSQRLIRDNFLSSNIRNSPMQNNHSHKPKNKQSKMVGLKYAFENRKFTNISKYKSSMGTRNNPFSSGKVEFERQPNTILSRKVSKQNSKTRIKTTEQQKSLEEDNVIEDNEIEKINEVEIKDLDLLEYIDSENILKNDKNSKILTLEHIFNQAYQQYQTYIERKEKQPAKNERKSSKQNKDKNLQKSLKLLKTIEKQTGSLSRKTVLLLGMVSYHSNEFSNCIFYLQNIFREVNYNLFLIDSLKTWISSKQLIKFCSQIFIVLAESYKKTENFLCSIKVLDQWEKNIVQRFLKDHQRNQPKQAWIQKQKRTISNVSHYQNYQSDRKLSRNDPPKHEYESITLENELNPKKKSFSLLRQRSQRRMEAAYLSSTAKERQRTQSLVKKDSIKYQTQQLNIKPRSKHLSIKTLSDINLNLNQENNVHKIDEEQFNALPTRQKQIFAIGYLMRARIQFEIKNFYASIQDYERNLACSQQNLEPGLQLATLYYKIGRKDQCIEFLKQFLENVSQSTYINSKKQQSIKQIKYHLSVMLYKCAKYQDSVQVLESLQKQSQAEGIQGQICFYTALNMIKLKNVFSLGKELSEQETNKTVENILIILQQSIDLGCSQFYIYAAYFLRIYLLLFKVRHYYGAQYEIDRMKESIERKKYGLMSCPNEKQRFSQTSKLDYRQISIQPFSHIINLEDLIQLTSGIICILKLKLTKGLKLISQIQQKVKVSRKILLSTNIISIQPHLSTQVNLAQNDNQSSEILKLMYEFKYYGLFTMRQYQKAVRYLEKIRVIDMMNRGHQDDKNNKKPQIQDEQEQQWGIPHSLYSSFKSDSDKLNYLNLQSLILISQKKFHQALKILKLIQAESSPSQKNHKRTRSGNLDTISTVIQYKKDQNMFHIIKALCYILLYKYLEDQKMEKVGEREVKEIKIQDSIDSAPQKDSQQSIQQQQNNQQILLVAEDLLSQCLQCDKQNFQILYLIAVIHYQLARYESALNYIRQAIQLSDDHMIKHYYLKANMKLMLGKYDQAIKDYSNAVTVYKEFQKDKKENNASSELDTYQKSETSHVEAQHDELIDSVNPIYNNNQSAILTTRTQNSKDHSNQYYEQEQQMHLQIYLNRAIAYLKYAYSLQYETCKNFKLKADEESKVRYSDVRENIVNLKATAAQDINLFFAQTIKLMKKEFHSLHNPKHPSNKSTITHNESSPPAKLTDVTPSKHPAFKKFVQKAMKLAPYVQLLLHTSEVEPMLEISRTFVKEFDIKLISDEELLVYFYIAKELNNCLLLMEKIIKKYYLSEKIKREANRGKKQITSKNDSSECQPYFKSKKDYKMQRSHNYLQFNAQKYTPKHIKHQNQSNLCSSKQSSPSQHEKIQRLIFDKKVLSALKDSSSNSREDYENALVTLLEEQENIRKSSSDSQNYQGGNIFTYPDLTFFIGVLYYLLEDYQSAIKHFLSSYTIKKKQEQLYSLKTIATTNITPSFEDSSSDSVKWHGQKLQMSNLKSFDEIYDNRIYSKEEIEYNIGLAYLMAQDYNSAYDYLEKHEAFVQIIENILSQNDSNLDDKKTKNKLKKMKKTLSDSEKEDDLSFDQVSVKTKTNKQNQSDNDVTPFPTHNRLCSIYPQKQINGKSFFLSFCLPKIDLPLFNLFSPDEIEIANLYYEPAKQDEIFDSSNLFKLNQTKDKQSMLVKNKSPQKLQNTNKSFQNGVQKFLVKKESIMNFLEIISLKDIEMKPIAPWIKKDKQKKCIRFTDNFLAESFDLKTQTTTERKHRNSSKKDMFGKSSSKGTNKKPTQKNEGTSQRKQNIDKFQHSERQKANVVKLLKKSKAEEYNFLKQKQKQKTTQNRYETIQNE